MLVRGEQCWIQKRASVLAIDKLWTYTEDGQVVLVRLIEDVEDIADPGNQAHCKIDQHVRHHALDVRIIRTLLLEVRVY